MSPGKYIPSGSKASMPQYLAYSGPTCKQETKVYKRNYELMKHICVRYSYHQECLANGYNNDTLAPCYVKPWDA